MYIKIVIVFLFSLIIFPTLYAQRGNVFTEEKDSIVKVVISNKISNHEVIKMDHPFFDTDDNKIFYQLTLSGIKNLKTSSFLYLEVKKKTNMQFKLKPLYAKKILLDSLHLLNYTDSFMLQEVRLGSGNFDLLISLMNDSNKVLDVKKTGFQLLRDATEKTKDEYYELQANIKGNIVDIANTFVAKYDLETIKRNINSLQPIAEGIEIKVIRDITTMDDMNFLKQFFYNFWYNRNASDPEDDWKKYVEKLNFVAKNYGTSTRPGYETDRGRIYIHYGEPQKIERVPSEKDALPYEIWFYKYIGNKSNISFLFYQPGMVGSQMFLLHSNFDGEIRNPYWKETLLRDPTNSDNKLMHRAFEFFK